MTFETELCYYSDQITRIKMHTISMKRDTPVIDPTPPPTHPQHVTIPSALFIGLVLSPALILLPVPIIGTVVIAVLLLSVLLAFITVMQRHKNYQRQAPMQRFSAMLRDTAGGTLILWLGALILAGAAVLSIPAGILKGLKALKHRLSIK